MIQNFSDSHLGSFTLQTKVEKPTLFDYSKEIILNVLEQNNGNQTKTAEQLGISRTTLWRYLKED
ncbi:helix-turn-helix domain-containing protein [Enterococcus malodoratus]|uniref:helix-turn-helix domain-containing protein n=1 Tax=Enterococcus malodoratus TaxID=71451 RepID=UPI0003A5C187|nr:helix-turn-helix domain-containing protein [Enterococcus malodoratus]